MNVIDKDLLAPAPGAEAEDWYKDAVIYQIHVKAYMDSNGDGIGDFAGLMSRHVRRNPKLVFGWAVYLLIMHFMDVYWMIMPEALPAEGATRSSMGGFSGVLSSLLCVGGMLALMTGLLLLVAQQTKVVAVRDPRLRESIAFENI